MHQASALHWQPSSAQRTALAGRQQLAYHRLCKWRVRSARIYLRYGMCINLKLDSTPCVGRLSRHSQTERHAANTGTSSSGGAVVPNPELPSSSKCMSAAAAQLGELEPPMGRQDDAHHFNTFFKGPCTCGSTSPCWGKPMARGRAGTRYSRAGACPGTDSPVKRSPAHAPCSWGMLYACCIGNAT